MENKNLVLNNNRSTYFLFWQYYIKYDNLVNELNKFNLLQFIAELNRVKLYCLYKTIWCLFEYCLSILSFYVLSNCD